MSPVTVSHRPPYLGAVGAGVAALLSVGLLATSHVARTSLLVEGIGLLLLGGGFASYVAGRRTAGVTVALVGCLVAVASFGMAVLGLPGTSALLETLPGMVGVFLLALALIPVRGHGSRGLLKAGTALVFLGVMVSGVLQRTSLTTMLLAGMLSIVAWDAGELGISLGEQLGRGAETKSIEITHFAGSLIVGAVAVLVATLVDGFGTAGLSFSSLVLVLVAVVLLTLALHD